MTPDGELVYGTCIALGNKATLLTGPSAAGKSDLALRFLLRTPVELSPALISDDQTLIQCRNGVLYARAPETIAGKIEVRGLGIMELPARTEAELQLVVRLVRLEDLPRMPPDPLPVHPICGADLPLLHLTAFEASADLKLRLAMQSLIG